MNIPEFMFYEFGVTYYKLYNFIVISVLVCEYCSIFSAFLLI